MKDWLLSKALKAHLSERLARYGELKSFAVDSRLKSIDLVIQPHGETDDVHVKVLRYAVAQRDGKHLITVERSTTSRPWLTHVLEDFLQGRSFEIPPLAAAVL